MNKMAKAPHILLLAAIFMLSACSQKKSEEAAHKHEAWTASLADSIAFMKHQIAENDSIIESLHKEVAERLMGFSHIDNPREVEGYTVVSSHAGRLPLTSTGLAARITEDEGFELLSALSGGTYSRISVSSPKGSASTADVPHDQALNYRHSGYNTVAFHGEGADSVGMLIAHSTPGSVRIVFHGSSGKSMKLSKADHDMVARTWLLFDAQRRAEKMERDNILLTRKIQSVRRIADHAPASE